MMKSHHLLTFVVFCIALAFSACQNSESERIRNEARQTLPAPPPNSVVSSPTAPAFPTFNNNTPHYKCPNNCAGGIGDAAGNCPACGRQLAHNQAYHDQANTVTTPNITTPTVTQQATTPAQNAAGVFHYTCSNGCAGGGATAGLCTTCGATLAHNTAYHGN